MKITYITLFENLIKFYYEESILKIAKDKKLIDIDFFNPRDFTKSRHKKVDDTICGGGAGLLMSIQPLYDCLDTLQKDSYIIFPLASAKRFTQTDAKRLSKKKNLVFVCGRYEGIDERVIEKYAHEVFSIGDYILTGGELSSLVMSDAILRNVDEVLGNMESLDEESYENNLLEAPSFTKPKNFNNDFVPNILFSGHHKNIKEYKLKLSKAKTKYFRPDLV
jgi:tRNA (guanine37-N1)-methyltransferase